MRGEEVWAQRIIGIELGVEVLGHDDNSSDSMFDLRVGPAHAPSRAIEVVGAVDDEWTETWNLGPARSGTKLASVGDWMVIIRPGARIKRLRRELPRILDALGGRGVEGAEIDSDPPVSEGGGNLDEELDALGVQSLRCYDPNGSGVVHMTLPAQGGMVHEDGNLVADWLVQFLSDPEQADVLHKLALATAADRRELHPAHARRRAVVRDELPHRPPRSPAWRMPHTAAGSRWRLACSDHVLPPGGRRPMGRGHLVPVQDRGREHRFG